MKNLEKLDKYVIVPNVAFYGGFKYDGEDIFLCEDHDTDAGYDFKVTQKIESDVLITDIEKTYEQRNGKKVTEKSHLEIEILPGQLLVYVEGVGFTLPEYKMCEIDEAKSYYDLLNNGKGDEKADD